MALELVGGALLSVFLDVAFQKLASSQILDFFHERKLDQKLLYKLETKLHSIHSLADDAEGKQFTDPHVRNWLLKVKGSVIDAEDLLDDIQDLSKREVDAESQTITCCTFKVLNFFKSSPISSVNKEIESRMEQILEVLEFLSSQKGALRLKTASGVRSGLSNELPQKSQTTSLVVETDIYGRDHDKNQIVNWLISDNNNHNQPSILSIVGMGGVGKTTLAQLVFNDPRVDEAQFNVKAWVCVSDEFDVFKVSRAILEAVSESTDDSRDLEMVQRRLKEKLTGKRFLLVLDDVWNENQTKWEEVQKPLMFGVQGSRILVTTRSKEVASTMRSKEVYFLELLQEDDCWNLFAKYAFQDFDTQQNPECQDIGKKIVEKCKGLPLALKTMGSLLYNKASVSEWETVFQSEIWEFSQERCDIIPALALSYIHLPSLLKVCFAYCALFPKDYEFKKEHLMHLWMTENLLQCPSAKVCEQYFNDLLSRSFFQQSGEKEGVFVMHDLLNDLANYIGGDIYFRWEVGQTEKIKKVTRHFSIDLGYNKYFDGFGASCNTKRLRTFMPIDLDFNMPIDSLHINMPTDSFRINIPTDSLQINMSIHELLSKFKFVRILSLAHCSGIEEVPDSIGNLEHLRLLDLSFTAIKKLSEKICSLSHLQILKLNYCRDLEELPSNLHLLTNLCRLELIENNVKKVPPHLGKLKNLKVVMNSFNVVHGREFGIQQLGGLNIDGSLSIRELQNIENSHDASEAYFKNKTLLVNLSLIWGWNRDSIDSKKEEEVIENLQPSENLKELSIFYYGGKQFPNWLHSLPNLVSLKLSRCESCKRLPPLGLLPFLKDLQIKRLDGIVSIDADFHGNNSSSFKSLQTLMFMNMREWEKWECKALERLQDLIIEVCPKLEALPANMHRLLPSLNCLLIEDCPRLESFPEGGLPSNLNDLTLYNCSRLVGSLKGAFGENCSLQRLCIRKLDVKCFPDEGLLPLSLTSLTICNGPNLKTLNYDDLHQLSSLESLNIKNCPNLLCLPEEGLPKSISYLGIKNCPLLEQRCQKEGGEDWEKIAHIEKVKIW